MEISILYGRISSYLVKNYSNRHCTFFALRSFAQFLIKLGQLEEAYLLKIKPLRPKRVVPAKRTVLRDKEMLEKFRAAIQKEHYESEWSYLEP